MSLLGQRLVSLENKVAYVSNTYNPILNTYTIYTELSEMRHHLTSQIDQIIELFPEPIKIYTCNSVLEYILLY